MTAASTFPTKIRPPIRGACLVRTRELAVRAGLYVVERAGAELAELASEEETPPPPNAPGNWWDSDGYGGYGD